MDKKILNMREDKAEEPIGIGGLKTSHTTNNKQYGANSATLKLGKETQRDNVSSSLILP